MNYFTNKTSYKIIKAVNDCGEDRYIEIPGNPYLERRELLNILLTKCKRLISFVSSDGGSIYDIMELSNNVRLALYRDDDIKHLYAEFYMYESRYKTKSNSSLNLNHLEN